MIPAILAPLLSGGLNLVGNAVLAKGKQWVEEKTGIDLSKASLSEEEMVKLEQFQMEHEKELLEIQLENNKLESDEVRAFLGDVQSARVMQMSALESDDKFVRRFVYYLALFWSFVGASFMISVIFFEIPQQNIRLVDTILGFLMGTLLAQVLNFFFGSTKGSKDKTTMMNELLKKVGDRK